MDGKRTIMSTKVYLLTATLVFVAVVTVSDVFARMVIAGDTLSFAISEHLDWLSSTAMGVVILYVPFGSAALICSAANKRAKSRSAVALFITSLITLGYFYFSGFQASQEAMLDKRWTAAILSLWLLPIFTGIPLLAIVAVLAVLIAQFDRRPTSES